VELDTSWFWLEDGGCFLCRLVVEIEEPRKPSFVAAVGIERVGPERSRFSVNQVLEKLALTSIEVLLAIELEHTEVSKDLTAFGISHLCAIRQLRGHHEAPNSCWKLKAGKSIRCCK